MFNVLSNRILILIGRMRLCFSLTYNKIWKSRIWANFAIKSYVILTILDHLAKLSVNKFNWYVTLLAAAEQFSRPY